MTIDQIAYILIGIAAFGLAFMLYFLPAIVAIRSNHPQRGAIFVLNLLGGFSGILWIVAMVWACIKSQPQQVVVVQAPPPPPYQPQIQLVQPPPHQPRYELPPATTFFANMD